MAKSPKTFYKYRAFSTKTLDSLCHDTLYFAHPGTFNDPLDCSPTLERNSNLEDLRTLLDFFVKRRVTAEVTNLLRIARVKDESANEYARKRAQREAAYKLADIAYNATNPDYKVEAADAEAWQLLQEIEYELHRHYESGVCCFSTTYANPLLWSHYGDQHQGLCIGYGVNRKPEPQLKKVVYGGGRAIKTSSLFNAFINGDNRAKTDLDRDALLRKARGWEYEHEWRLIGQQGIQDSPLLLKEVTFGLRCPESVKHAVVKALSGRNNQTKFYEMYEVRGRYVLRRYPLNTTELNMYLPKTAMSGVEAFGAHESA